MEINILKDEKEAMEFELKGEGHTFCNILRVELWNVEDIDFVGYNIKHPLISSPVFFVNVKKGKPKKVLLVAVDSLKDKVKEMRSLLKDLE